MAGTAVLLVRPCAFGFNPDTLASNPGQRRPSDAADLVAARGRLELDGVAVALDAAGVRVLLEEDTPKPAKPDAVFPNNWLATFPDGTVALFPMAAASRRAEVRIDLVDRLESVHGFEIRRRIDLRGRAAPGAALEGTGSLVFDHRARIAWAARSPRTDEGLAQRLCGALGYTLVAFDGDVAGVPPYHTNVILTVGVGWAAWAPDAVVESDRDRVRRSLEARGELIELNADERAAYAGNALELRGRGRVLLLSTAAQAALRPETQRALERWSELLPVRIPTIEAVGGGSARCLAAEILLPELAE